MIRKISESDFNPKAINPNFNIEEYKKIVAEVNSSRSELKKKLDTVDSEFINQSPVKIGSIVIYNEPFSNHTNGTIYSLARVKRIWIDDTDYSLTYELYNGSKIKAKQIHSIFEEN